MILDTMDFQEHFKDYLSKISKTIGLLRKLRKILPRTPLLILYKSFIRPHLDYGDITNNKDYNSSFHQNLEKIQYNSAVAIRGTSQRKTLHRVRIRISGKKTMVSETLLFLEDLSQEISYISSQYYSCV